VPENGRLQVRTGALRPTPRKAAAGRKNIRKHHGLSPRSTPMTTDYRDSNRLQETTDSSRIRRGDTGRQQLPRALFLLQLEFKPSSDRGKAVDSCFVQTVSARSSR
jgi:hypothetical protein